MTVRPPPPCQFQSTLPIQGETRHLVIYRVRGGISIHSPYTGRDTEAQTALSKFKYFNPLSLYRERLNAYDFSKGRLTFQSTLPIQGETQAALQAAHEEPISIHSPYTGRDRSRRRCCKCIQISIHSPYT